MSKFFGAVAVAIAGGLSNHAAAMFSNVLLN